MEVEIISETLLIPSSQTPPHLTHFKLSFLDQLIAAPYAPIVFYYNQVSDDHELDLENKLGLLRNSLSEILPEFYPLAGRIKDEMIIECNDEGLHYLEAQVNCRMSDFLAQPDLLLIHKLLPLDADQLFVVVHGAYVANVQVNVFKCGSLAISLCISHKILDGVGIKVFMNAWAAAARGEPASAVISPNFHSVSVFPAESLWLKEAAGAMYGSIFKAGNFITKRFVFHGASVAKLRDEVASFSESCKRYPSRVEAVTALLWKAFMNVCKQNQVDNNGVTKLSVMTHFVNLRRRAPKTLALSDQTLCNLLWLATATASADNQLSTLTSKIRGGIAKVDEEFVQKLSCAANKMRPVVLKSDLSDEVNVLGFTSWCKFGLYEVDFRWGRPIWISSLGMKASLFLNLALLVDTRDGDGIEAWITLDSSQMDLLEKDFEVLKFASVNPNALESHY